MMVGKSNIKRLLRAMVMLMLLGFLVVRCNSKKDQTQPNIVFLFADDLAYTGIHALGGGIVQTPHLDGLVQQGTHFTHAYNMGAWNGAVCQASRAMIISGRSVWRINQFRQKWRAGEEWDKTWPKLMESAGYNTYMTGKWHVDAPADKIFQVAKNIRPGMPRDHFDGKRINELYQQFGEDIPDSLMPIGYNRPLSPEDQSWSPTDSSQGGFWEGGIHWSEIVKQDAFDFMTSAEQEDKPFFMYLAFNAAHDPRQAPQSYLDLYPIENIEIPKNFEPYYEDRIAAGNRWTLRDEALAPMPRTEYAIKKHLQEYYALITHMDDQIGSILSEIEKRFSDEETYVFFTSDHGLAMGSHGLLGKQNMYEHSVKVPLVMKGPGIPANQSVDELVYLQDLMPTALAFSGQPIPEYVEFQNLMPLAQEGRTSKYHSIYGCYIDYQRMIHKGANKLIYYPKSNTYKLFNLENDPFELYDLSQSVEHQSVQEELKKSLSDLAQEYADTLILRG